MINTVTTGVFDGTHRSVFQCKKERNAHRHTATATTTTTRTAQPQHITQRHNTTQHRAKHKHITHSSYMFLSLFICLCLSSLLALFSHVHLFSSHSSLHLFFYSFMSLDLLICISRTKVKMQFCDHCILCGRNVFLSNESASLKMFKGEKSPRRHFVFMFISFLDVNVEQSSPSFPTSPILTNRLTIQTFSVHNIHGKKLQENPCEPAR